MLRQLWSPSVGHVLPLGSTVARRAWRCVGRSAAAERALAPRRREGDDRRMALEQRIKDALNEARMVLPGAQALLGFQFMSFFAAGFIELPRASRLIHFSGLLFVSLACILLIAPASFHRLAEQG